MEKQQQSELLASIGGEPLEGSGFESETPVLEQELPREAPAKEEAPQ